jgi:hypothetical protein
MDVGKSVGYVFEDQKWTNKLLIGMLVSIIPIVNFALLGWVIDIMRNVSRREPLPLPEWGDFGDKFVKGAILFVVGLIYSLPALLLTCPMVFLPFTRGDFGRDGQQAVASLFVGTTLALSCVIALYGLLLSFLMPAIYLNFARKGTFGACFEFGEIWRIMSKNLGDYIVAWLIIIVVGIGASFLIGLVGGVLALIPCCGWIAAWVLVGVTGVWILAVFGHLFGQIGAEPPGQSLTPSGQL